MRQSYRNLFASKDFKTHIEIVLRLLISGIPFAFNRISDGELFMLQGRQIELSERGAVIDDIGVNRQKFATWDLKSFKPERDTFISSELPKVLHSQNPLYLLGLPCPCCSAKSDAHLMRTVSSATLTWSNLLLNFNYRYFVETIFPFIQTQHVVAAVNHRAKYDAFSTCASFEHFEIPDNVIQHAPVVVERFLERCSSLPEGALVLVGASVVAKIMIHKAFLEFPCLTFIDIGTTLNPLLGLGLGRDYLRDYWLGNSARTKSPYSTRICVWE